MIHCRIVIIVRDTNLPKILGHHNSLPYLSYNYLSNSCPTVKSIYYSLMCLKVAGCVANSVDPDQMPHSVASDLGLHCLPGLSVCILQVNMVLINLSQSYQCMP